jgi:O-antigen/teichoic acid export membrane protein
MPVPKLPSKQGFDPAAGWWDKLHTRHTLLADAGVLFISNIANGVFGLLFWIVAARLYAPQYVGLGSAAISMMYLIGNLSRLGLDVALMRVLPGELSSERRRQMIVASLLIVAVIGLSAAVICIELPIVGAGIRNQLRNNLGVAVVFVLTCSAWGVGLVIDQILVAIKRGQVIVWDNLAFSIVKLAVLPLALSIVGQQYGIFAANALGVLAGITVVWYALRPSFWLRWQIVRRGLADVRSSLASYALLNHCSMLVAGLPNWLLPLIVAEQVGIGAAGHFYTGWMLMTLVNTGPAALGVGYFAQGARLRSDTGALLRRTSGYLLIVMVPIVAILIPTSGYLLMIFGNSYTEAATDMLRYLFAASIPFALSLLCLAQLRLKGDMRALNIASCSSTVVTLGLSYLLLPTLGLSGIGIAWLSACVITVSYCLWRLQTAFRHGGIDHAVVSDKPATSW